MSYELRQLVFKPSKSDQFIFYEEHMTSLVYVDGLLSFGKDLDKIDKVINKLNQIKLPLTVESDIFHLMGIYI